MKSHVRFIGLFFLVLSLSAHAAAAPLEGGTLPVVERVQALLASDQPAEALQLLESYRPTSLETSVYHAAYARVLVRLDRRLASIEHYRLAYLYALSPGEQEVFLRERADTFLAMNYNTEAALCYDVFLRTFPHSVSADLAHLGAGDAHYRLGQFREALREYEQGGASLGARSGRANSLQALGSMKEAYDLYRSILAEDKDIKFLNSSQETLYSMSVNFAQMDKIPDALMYLNSVTDPRLLSLANVAIGRVYLQKNKLDLAIKQLEAAEASSDRDVVGPALLLRAEAYEKQGKHQEALTTLRKIKISYPYGKHYDDAMLLLARLSANRGKPAEAIGYLQELIFRRTPSRAALEVLEAIMLEASRKDSAEFAKLWSGMGRWLMDPSRSANLITFAKALQPSGKPFLDLCAWLYKYGLPEAKTASSQMLARYYADQGDGARSLGYLARIKQKKDDEDILRIKARVAQLNRDGKRAGGMILGLRNPQESDAVFVLDLQNAGAGLDTAKVIAFCGRLLAGSDASPAAQIRFADYLYRNGKPVVALGYYRRSVADRPGTSARRLGEGDREWAYYRIARLAPGGETGKALVELEKGKGPAAHLAAADLKARALRERLP